MILLVTLFVLFGWLVGIAINHAADILPTRQTVFQWPKCAQCSAPRPLKQWSGLLNWLTGRRECPQCGVAHQRLVRSVVVELVTPIFFAFLWWYYGFSTTLGIVTLYTIILILVTVTDLEHRLIFNVVILPSILLAIAAAFITPDLTWRAALVGGITGFIIVYIAALLSRGGLGEGDVTLSTFLGFIMGFPNIILSLVFGVFMGGLVAFLLLVTGRVTLKTFIPYGPFLTITGWIMLVWGDEIWRYYFS
ncbi:MAG: prepilin peptidase [Anaerolineae bacterium]|nr:prepilin peptidase [Anaerolineae bacterium]